MTESRLDPGTAPARATRWGPSLLVAAAGLLPVIAAIWLVWGVDRDGVLLHNGKLPTWDFTSTWAGGVLGRSGRFDVLYDHLAYSDWLRGLYGRQLAPHEWLYPPVLLLLAVPLAMLPLYAAYAVWTLGSLALLAAVLGWAGFSAPAVGLALLSPALWKSVMLGQNGGLTAACLAGGLLLAKRKPVPAGLLLGLLVVKPHLALLVPVFLLATRAWRAGVTAALAACALTAVTWLIFGSEPFALFVDKAQPLMRLTLEAPWPTPYQLNGATIFMMARAFGATVFVAYALQIASAALSAVILWRVARDPGAEPRMLVALALCLTFLTTPYAFSYDCVPLEIAVLIVVADRHWRWTPLLGLAWVWPGLTSFVAYFAAPVAPLMTAALAVIIWIRLRRSRPSSGVSPVLVQSSWLPGVDPSSELAANYLRLK